MMWATHTNQFLEGYLLEGYLGIPEGFQRPAVFQSFFLSFFGPRFLWFFHGFRLPFWLPFQLFFMFFATFFEHRFYIVCSLIFNRFQVVCSLIFYLFFSLFLKRRKCEISEEYSTKRGSPLSEAVMFSIDFSSKFRTCFSCFFHRFRLPF